jgi:hypothetical protein
LQLVQDRIAKDNCVFGQGDPAEPGLTDHGMLLRRRKPGRDSRTLGYRRSMPEHFLKESFIPACPYGLESTHYWLDRVIYLLIMSALYFFIDETRQVA